MKVIELDPVKRLTRDLAKAAITLSPDEARFLVDAYYQMQKNRIRSGNQIRSLAEAKEPHEVLGWFAQQDATLEQQIGRALDKYTEDKPLAQWARSISGIGPIIAAGLLAHIDLERAPTVSHVWSFAGLNPTKKWNRGEKRPWNASLKRLCWIIGESFVKVKGKEDDIYGKVYESRRTYEHEKNEKGEYAAQAKAIAEARPSHKQIATYRQGRLPDGQLYTRAKRYAVKLFLAHYHQVGLQLAGRKPVAPYPTVHLRHEGHRHVIAPPKMPKIAKVAKPKAKSRTRAQKR